MFAVRDVVKGLGIPDKRLYKWIRRYNLGQKVGFGIVLFQKDIDFLKAKLQAAEGS